MKIGILTYHAVANFGAQLQILSTVSYLKRKKYTPLVINWYPKDLEAIYKNNVSEKQFKAHADFVANLLPATALCRTEEDIIKVIRKEKIEGLIIGSDAVLNYQTFRSRINFSKLRLDKKQTCRTYPNPFWGNFIIGTDYKIPMVMLSVSSQNSPYHQIHNPLKEKMGKSLLHFDYISVRDDWTQNMITYLTKGKVMPTITPDPVFGFNINEIPIPSKNEIIKKYNLPDKYILFSFKNNGKGKITKEWSVTFEKLTAQSGCACIALCMPEGIGFENNFKYKVDTPLNPLDWYALIKYSQGYVGHNMHPIVVAIHNVVPFFSFDHYGITKYRYFIDEKSSKIYHILKNANLLAYRCSAAAMFRYKAPSPEKVYDCILNFDKKVCEEFSRQYLKQYLNMMEDIENIFNKYVNK